MSDPASGDASGAAGGAFALSLLSLLLLIPMIPGLWFLMAAVAVWAILLGARHLADTSATSGRAMAVIGIVLASLALATGAFLFLVTAVLGL